MGPGRARALLLAKLGIEGVTISVNYPILDPEFPGQARYAAFYRRVAREVRGYGMTLAIETDDLFSGTPYSSVRWSYAGLTLDSYARAKAAMARVVIANMHPRYLSLEGEADTEAFLTGLPLDNPANYARIVSAEIARVGPHPGTLLGAGPGSWSPLAFDRALAPIRGLDYLDTHLYPTDAQAIANIDALAQIAHARRKLLVMEEAWLYKALGPDPLAPLGETNLQAHVLSYYSFFAPLDQEFLSKLVALTRADGFSYVSPFGEFSFLAYLDYTPAMASMSFRALTRAYDGVVAPALAAGSLSATGEAYARLVG